MISPLGLEAIGIDWIGCLEEGDVGRAFSGESFVDDCRPKREVDLFSSTARRRRRKPNDERSPGDRVFRCILKGRKDLLA